MRATVRDPGGGIISARFQRAVIYGATALAFSFAVYFFLFLSYRPNWVSGSAVDRLASNPALWPLTVATAALLLAAVMSLGGWRSAAYVAIAGSFLGLVTTSIQLCVFAFFLFLPLLGSGGYFSVVFPFLLSVGAIATSVQVLRSDETRAAPLDVLSQRSWQGYLSLAFVAVTCLTAILAGVAEISLRGMVVETHEMRWQSSSTSHCDAYLELEFAAAPGYAISTCSPELREYLVNQGDELVEVDLQRNYEWGAWRYRLKSVGDWNGSPALSGLSWSCPTQLGDCPRSSRPPLRQPYILR